MVKKVNKRVFVWCVAVLTIIVCYCQMSIVYAKENKMTDSDNLKIKSSNLDTNSYKVLKIDNPDSKVKWTLSEKGYINIVEMQGDKNNCIIVKSGNKEGTCILRAKTAKETYLWKIAVKKDKKNSKATLAKVNKTDTGLDVTIKFSNKTKKRKEYGYSFYVEKMENGHWKKLKMQEDYDFEEIAKCIPIKGSVKETYKVGNCYNLEDLEKGIYRISLNVNFARKNSKVLFYIK